MIPNIIHFIFGLQSSRPFAFLHYLAVKSAHDCNKPEAIKFHYKYEPTGEWWEKSKPYLTLVKVEPPTEIFGNKIDHYAHQTDVLRVEILLREGGIYLDIDVVCFNSFKSLLKHECVMGREGDEGLCNAVILTKPNTRFLKEWHESFHYFDGSKWNEHAVRVPLRIANKFPECIHIEDRYAFFWPLYWTPEPLWDEPHQQKTFKSRVKHKLEAMVLSQSYCVHLWNQLWWDKYLSNLSPEYILSSQNVFSRTCKKFLEPSNGSRIIEGNNYRFLLLFFLRMNLFRIWVMLFIQRLRNVPSTGS